MPPEDTRRSLDDILAVIAEFEQGGMDVSHLQSALEARAATLDNSTRDVLDELRAVDADLETILFTMSTHEQSAAARLRVCELQQVVSRTKLSE